VHRRRMELEEVSVGQRVDRGAAVDIGTVRGEAEKGVKEGRGRKEGASRRGAPLIAVRGGG
jgi:hypothetical protein